MTAINFEFKFKKGPQGGAIPVNDIPVQVMNAKPIGDPFKAPQFKNDNEDDYENFDE